MKSQREARQIMPLHVQPDLVLCNSIKRLLLIRKHTSAVGPGALMDAGNATSRYSSTSGG